MIVECPICNALVHLKVETYLREREVNCASCNHSIQFYNPDGSPLFLKLSITDSLIESKENEDGSS